MLLASDAVYAAAKGMLRIGKQKSSFTLVLARAKGAFEARISPLGYDVAWAEFPSSPTIAPCVNGLAVLPRSGIVLATGGCSSCCGGKARRRGSAASTGFTARKTWLSFKWPWQTIPPG